MKKTTIKNFLESGDIPKKLLDKVNRSFEIVGDIAICEINDELIPYEVEIGNAIMEVNKSINTVLKKSGIHGGEFRTQDLIYISGENKKETIYQENGVQLKINPETVYFSSRLSVERQNLMDKLAPNKKVLVMFSGIGPYTFVGLKKQANLSRITSIELNPEGHKYAKENLILNKNILKKSIFYKNLIQYLRNNKLPVIDKIIISNLNFLRIQQINGDVKEECKYFDLKEFNDEILNYFEINKSPNKLFNELREKEEEEIYLNLDELNFKQKKEFSFFYTLFCNKFTFICKINNQNYIFDSQKRKGFLLNYLETEKLENLTKFDEIYMPLPKDAYLFLESAFGVVSPNGIIHMYDFVDDENFPIGTENRVKLAGEKFNKSVEIIETRKVGQYAPGKWRVCCDFKVL